MTNKIDASELKKIVHELGELDNANGLGMRLHEKWMTPRVNALLQAIDELEALKAELEALKAELEAAKNQKPAGYMANDAALTSVYNAVMCSGDFSSYTPVYKRPVPAKQPKLPDGRLYAVDVYNENGEILYLYGIGDLFITGKQINEIIQGQGNDQ